MDKTLFKLPNDVSFKLSKQPNQGCPNCGAKGLTLFYSVKNIPVHCCQLMASKEQATKAPADNLQLGFCNSCGFITNICFDSQRLDYSNQYEETQGFSECFSSFAKSLVQRLINNYNIRNKTILEIGCGKGEFLALMCKLGDNRGIGIDPAYVPERNPTTNGCQVEFIRDFYSEKYAHLKADVICCRHTLEHISTTMNFVTMLRQAIGNRTDTLVFFEVPDVMRVLQEGAFWDIYYEHCSYFTTGSLAKLFRATGFEIDQLYSDYDDQYIILTAYPADGFTTESTNQEEDLYHLSFAAVRRNGQAFREFNKKCSEKILYWLNTIRHFANDDQKTVLWGGGSKAVAFLTTLKIKNEIQFVVDINPYKQNKYMPGTGQEIVPPQFLSTYLPQKIIVMNPIYYNEIKRELDRLNVKADLLSI
jgi:SAM-dependent methyltransferase